MEKDVPRRTTRRMRTSIEDRRKDEDQDKEGNRMEKDETRRTTGRMRTSIEDHRKNESKVKEDKRKLEVRCNYSMSIWSTKQSKRKLSIRIILSLIFLEKRTVLVTTAVATGGWVGCAVGVYGQWGGGEGEGGYGTGRVGGGGAGDANFFCCGATGRRRGGGVGVV